MNSQREQFRKMLAEALADPGKALIRVRCRERTLKKAAVA